MTMRLFFDRPLGSTSIYGDLNEFNRIFNPDICAMCPVLMFIPRQIVISCAETSYVICRGSVGTHPTTRSLLRFCAKCPTSASLVGVFSVLYLDGYMAVEVSPETRSRMQQPLCTDF